MMLKKIQLLLYYDKEFTYLLSYMNMFKTEPKSKQSK